MELTLKKPFTSMLKSIKILIAITRYHDYKIRQMDVKIAFINWNLQKYVYKTQIEGGFTSNNPNKVYKLQKSFMD